MRAIGNAVSNVLEHDLFVEPEELMMGRVCVVHNSADDGIGYLRELFREFNLEPRMVTRESRLCNVELGQFELVVLMGSDWSTYWSEVENEVKREEDLVRTLISDGVPLLGICFGAQLISQACGGTVRRLPKPEIGWSQVHGIGESALTGSWMQWHYDAFTAPPGFEVVGMNDIGVQGIRVGRCLGLQFHPEANFALVSRWIASGGDRELESLKFDSDKLLAETKMRQSGAEQRCYSLFNWFFESIVGLESKDNSLQPSQLNF